MKRPLWHYILATFTFGILTFWGTVLLAAYGLNANPYIVWIVLWGACNLAMVGYVAFTESDG